MDSNGLSQTAGAAKSINPHQVEDKADLLQPIIPDGAVTSTPEPTLQYSTSQSSSVLMPSTSSKLKQRRVSTSALPTISHGEPGSTHPLNWTFRDEMGISSHISSSAALPVRGRESSGGIKKAKPRRVMSSEINASTALAPPDPPRNPVAKRPRRNMWTEAETKALVDGCNEHGVGNWKAILDDHRFEFQDRSPVDLKDRFRVSFPEAYRKHYPNAKTHLSKRITPVTDSSPLFEKTRPNKRRPFSTEEDEALRKGYEKHGPVWATIVKDPIFQSRRSTDLRDRFRNAFPGLYAKAGYKPRQKVKKTVSEPSTPAEDAPAAPQQALIERKLRQMSDAMSRPTMRVIRGSKSQRSVDENAPCSDSDESSNGGDDVFDRTMSVPPTPHGTTTVLSPKDATTFSVGTLEAGSSQGLLADFEKKPLRSALESRNSSQARLGSQGGHSLPDEPYWLSTPTSPSSSEYLFSASSPARIGNSAWGPSWLSPNPRLDGHGSFKDSPLTWPSIPEYGVFDRYDLYSGAPVGHDFASDAGNRHSHSYLDPAGAFPGFTHHHYAGDLISGAGVLPGQDFEYLSTTSGTSYLDVGQLSLQGVEDSGETLGIEDPLTLNDQSVYATSIERPRTAEPGSLRPFGHGEVSQSRRRSTPMSPSNALQLDPMRLYPQSECQSAEQNPITHLTGPFASLTESNRSPPVPTITPLHTIRPTVPMDSFAIRSLSSPQARTAPVSFASFSSFSASSSRLQHAFDPASPHTRTQAPTQHHRSSSQPPQEHRQAMQRSASLYDYIRFDDMDVQGSVSQSQPASLTPTYVEPLSTAALDLHYGVHTGPPVYRAPGSTTRNDANNGIPTSNIFRGGPFSSIPAFSVQPMMSVSTGSSRAPKHLRGQSFTVSPAQLSDVGGAVGYKKRKRASWDGRPA